MDDWPQLIFSYAACMIFICKDTKDINICTHPRFDILQNLIFRYFKDFGVELTKYV